MSTRTYLPTYLDLSEFRATYLRTIARVRFEGHTRGGSPTTLDWNDLEEYVPRLLQALAKLRGDPLEAVTVEVYEDSTPKGLPKRGGAITPDHVNSGLTWFETRGGAKGVVIFRTEEFAKVLCHELLHYYGIGEIRNEAVQRRAIAIFDEPGIASTLSINEAITELNATIINAQIRTGSNEAELEEALMREYTHTMRTIALLRAHFGIAKTDQSWKGWKETTHAFSYYVAKGIFLAHVLNQDPCAFKYVKEKRRGDPLTMTVTGV